MITVITITVTRITTAITEETLRAGSPAGGEPAVSQQRGALRSAART